MQKSGGILPIFRQEKIYLSLRQETLEIKSKMVISKLILQMIRKMPMMISNSTPNKFCLNFKVDVVGSNFPTA